MRSGGKTSPPSVGQSHAKSLRSAQVQAAGDEGYVLRAAPPTTTTARHIHPCACDLSEEQLRRIAEFHRKKKAEQDKLVRRMREIEEELRRMEEMYNLKADEQKDMEEFYGDQYEIIRGKKKRKKRSARRASMVTLGVKQRITWWKQPEIAVSYNQTYKLRHENNTYCARTSCELPEPRAINYEKRPLIPVRITRTSAGRAEVNSERKERLKAEIDDPRPLFVSAFSC